MYISAAAVVLSERERKIEVLKNLMSRIRKGVEAEARRGSAEAAWLLNHL